MKKAATPDNTPLKDVDDYMNRLPEEARPGLDKLRKAIRAAAPKAEEVISYQIPTYKLKGALVAFGAGKNHLAMYVMSIPVMNAFREELEAYDKAPTTIRFPFNSTIPAALVKKIVQARIEENLRPKGTIK